MNRLARVSSHEYLQHDCEATAMTRLSRWSSSSLAATATALISALSAGESMAASGAQEANAPAAASGLQGYLDAAERSINEPLQGVSVGDPAQTAVYESAATPGSAAIRKAAVQFLEGLSADQRTRVQFDAASPEWRRWSNIHRYPRDGLALFEMTGAQRTAVFNLLQAALGPTGVDRARRLMQSDQHLAGLTDKPAAYGAHRYWISIMGDPASTSDWGFQLDGHHLIVNAREVDGTWMVAPVFMGAEPAVIGEDRLFGAEEDAGLAFMRSLTDAQRRTATVAERMPRADVLATAFRDNLALPEEGLPLAQLDDEARTHLLALVESHVLPRTGVTATAVTARLQRDLAHSHFVWKGPVDDVSPFYYRLQGPSLLIEFAHQAGTAIDDPTRITRRQVHTVLRLPNGGDYAHALKPIAARD